MVSELEFSISAPMEANKSKENGIGLSYPMLTKTNYAAWAQKMMVFMQAHGVWDAIEPKDPKTIVDDKIDKRALAVIYQGIPEDLLLALADKKTSKEAWNAVKTMSLGADKVKKAKAQTLKGEFENLSMKDSDQLDDFYLKLHGLVSNIRALGEKMEESYVVKKLLRAVPSKFLQIASAIEQFGKLEEMSVEEVVGSLKAHEERMRGSSETNQGHLLLTEEEWRKRDSSEGHLLLTREEWMKKNSEGTRNINENRGREANRGGRDRSKLRCFNCQGLGHFAYECRKPRRGREVQKEVNLSQIQGDEPALLIAEVDKVERKNMMLLNEEMVAPKLTDKAEGHRDSLIWYLDNGASNHMTGQRGKFKELDESVTGKVKFGDGSTVNIKGKGVVAFKCKNGEEKMLNEVYYIPTLCNNIISLGQLSEAGNKVILEGDYLWVYEEQGRLLMKVKRTENRLYKISLEESSQMCFFSKNEEDTWMWHTRLGHVNFQALELMSREGMAHGIPRMVQPKEKCEGCLMTKLARTSFPSHTSFETTTPLELVYADICGPIMPETPGGNRYFLLFVDDYSRKMWVYLLKEKSDAFGMFKKYKAVVEKGTGKSIKMLRTDRGGEFCSKEFTSYCEEMGIERQYTAPYTPQQNGVVERRNRTVAAMTRSFLRESKLPSYMWGEAVRHSVYVLNRLPTRALNGTTPYEAWGGRKPNLKHIRLFGCIAIMKVPSVHVSKLDDRGRRVVYLGREPGTKGCRLYDPVTKKLQVSRDVVFREKEHWSWEKNEQDVNIPGLITMIEDNSEKDSSTETGETCSTPVRMIENRGADMSVERSAATPASKPRKYRGLDELYSETEVIEMLDELMLLKVEEPMNYQEASMKKEWKDAMNMEMETIEKNNTWVLMDLPPGHKPIGLKWVFKLKKDSEGNVVKHKARLVAKGYVQRKGIDYNEVFAPVARLETIRLLLALSAKEGWEVHHLDVKSAFLNGELLEEVYVMQPEGFEKKGEERKVYRLLKALYGLRQAPRAWNARLDKCLRDLGFRKCQHEQAVYTKCQNGNVVIIGVYVDDLLVAGSDQEEIELFKKKMNEQFEMNNLGLLSYYLGIEVHQGKACTTLKQSAYAKKILENAGMWKCNLTRSPMDQKLQLDKDEDGQPVNSTEYRSVVGSLRYLTHTRPDITFAVGVVSRFMERPTVKHQQAVKQILRYVKGTVNHGLAYARNGTKKVITGYTDSDLAGDVVDRRSTGGMCFYLNGSLISWASQKQRVIALSSCEAEYMAATTAACQSIWLRGLLGEISGQQVGAVVLCIDNKSAIELMKNPVLHGRSKHIDVRFHFIRECIERGELVIKYVGTQEQRADILTKALGRVKFEEMKALIGVENLAE